MELLFNIDINEYKLIKEFNLRNELAFSEVYEKLFHLLNYFSSKLFSNLDIDSQDIVQDIFLNIYTSNHKFTSVQHVKNYAYQAIKNKHKNVLKHNVNKIGYASDISLIDDYQFSQLIETEVVSILVLAKKILNDSCFEIIKLYIEGYDIKDISGKLNKSHYTIYHKKQEAIKDLRKYVTKNKITFLLNFLSI